MSGRITFRRKGPEAFLLSGLDLFLASVLRALPSLGAPSAETESRMFPSLTAGQDAESDQEWKEFVRPELEEQFRWNRDTVAEDLKGMSDRGRGTFELEIPTAHLVAWIHALNQARISIAVRFSLEDRDPEDSEIPEGPEGMALFQIHFFGVLQEWMLEATDSV